MLNDLIVINNNSNRTSNQLSLLKEPDKDINTTNRVPINDIFGLLKIYSYYSTISSNSENTVLEMK